MMRNTLTVEAHRAVSPTPRPAPPLMPALVDVAAVAHEVRILAERELARLRSTVTIRSVS